MSTRKLNDKNQVRERLRARQEAWISSSSFVLYALLNEHDAAAPGNRLLNRRAFMKIYQAPPPSPDATWMTPEAVKETPETLRPHCYLMATDGARLHAALLPQAHADWLLAEEINEADEGQPDFGGFIDQLNDRAKDGRRSTINLQTFFLEEAIHPDAASIQLTTGAPGEPIEVFSFMADGTQVGYAMLMPFADDNGRHVGQRPQLPARQQADQGD